MNIVLVTGGAGFIGSHLAEALSREGRAVRVVDNLATGKVENLASLSGRVDFIKADLRDPEVCKDAVEGAQVVFHLAALGSVPRSVKDPLATHEANVTATLNLLLAAREAGVKRVVIASSSSVYGDNPALPKREDMTPMPCSPYAASKLAQEQYGLAFHATYGLSVTALRYFNVYGPRQDPNSPYAAVIPLFVKAALSGEPPVIHGDGEQTRDFTFVEDCVEATLAAGESESASGQIINISGGRETSINELWAMVKKETGASSDPVHGRPRPGDVRRSRADISKARELLGWSPRTTLEQGLRKTIAWMKTAQA